MNDTSIKKKKQDFYKILINRCIGTVGMLILISGNFVPPSNLRASLFMIGTLFMLTTAFIEYHLFFLASQFVILSGTIIYFFPIPILLKAAVPFMGALILISYLWMTNQLHDKLTLLGSFGIIMLALGYGTGNPYIYLFGGLSFAIFSFISYYQGVTIAILWAILNTFFSCAALINIFYYHRN